MKRILLFVVLILTFLDGFSSSQYDFFRTFKSGNWNDLTVWESSIDNNTWVTATRFPTNSSSGVFIRSGHEITVTANLSMDDLVVLNGATIVINPLVSFNVLNGSAVIDVNVLGIIRNQGLINITGNLTFGSTGIYQHNYTTTPGRIPISTWSDGSKCEIIGYTGSTGNLSGINQNFYDLIWNCVNQTASSFVNLDVINCIVRNNFNLISSGLGGILLSGLSSNFQVLNYNQLGGNLIINQNNNANTTANIFVSNQFNIAGGILSKGAGVSVGNIIFNGTTSQNYIKTGGTLSQAINFIVNPSAIVNFGNNIINGNTGRFTASAGSTIITSNTAGFALTGATGSVQSTGIRSYNTAANYTYNGNSQQQTGAGLPLTVNNLTVDNAAGVILRPGDLSINGELAINNGFLNAGTNALISNGPLGMVGIGELRTQNVSATPLSGGKTWGGTVLFNGITSQTIPSGIFNNLTLNNNAVNNASGNLTVNSVLALNASSLNMGTAALISINGNTGGGTISTQNTSATPISVDKTWAATINYNSNNAQSVVGGNYASLSTATGGTKTVTGIANITNTVVVNSPSILDANANLILLATATSNANIAALTGSADVIGSVNFQTYLYGVPSGRARGVKSMSSPLNDALIGGNKTYAQLKNFVPITGPGGVSNGFDAGFTASQNPAILNTYFEPANTNSGSIVPVPTLATSNVSGVGYTLFFTGNRTNMYTNPGKFKSPFPPAEDVLVTFIGPINKGSIDIPVSFTADTTGQSGLFLAGNPYPSTIDWHEVQMASDSLSTTILTITGGKPNATYNSANFASVNGGSRYIQPSQGFYVQAKSGGGTIRFRENQKNVINAPARLLSTPINQNPVLASLNGEPLIAQNNLIKTISKLKISLSTNSFKEEALVLFDENALEGITKEDSPYLEGYDINIATLEKGSQPLAINYSKKLKSLKLWVNSLETNSLVLSFDELPFDNIILVDHYLENKVSIDLKNNTYSFNIDKSIPNSFGANRFELLFGQSILDTELAAPLTLSVYPNPTKSELNIQYNHKDNLLLEASIFDLQGRKMKSISLSSNQNVKVDVNDLVKGIYIVELKSSITGDLLGSTKFIKD